jgi:general secretion pathway protein F
MQFHIKALAGQDQVSAVTVDAADEAAARDWARAQGYTVLGVRKDSIGLPGFPGARADFDTTLFSVELAALLNAGLGLVEALEALSEKESRGERRRVLGGILAELAQGQPLSSAMGHYPQHFPALYAALIRASERTGDLKQALARYIGYREELDRVRKKILAALIYPVILTAVGSLVMAFLMFYVVPRFSKVYEDIAGELPFFSKLLLAAGRMIEAHGWVVAVMLVAVATAAGFAATRQDARARVNEQLWRIPALGVRMRVYQLARLYRTLGMLLRGGIPILPAMDMVQGLLSSRLQLQLAHARRLLAEGQAISHSMGTAGLTTSVASRMLAVGEKSGSMGEMMERIAAFYDEDSSRWVDWFTRLFEPLLMAAIGLAVGLVVVLMYMPIFELAGSIQ